MSSAWNDVRLAMLTRHDLHPIAPSGESASRAPGGAYRFLVAQGGVEVLASTKPGLTFALVYIGASTVIPLMSFLVSNTSRGET
jgi:hypothetical protein